MKMPPRQNKNTTKLKNWHKVLYLAELVCLEADPEMSGNELSRKIGAWLYAPNRQFDGNSPLEMMQKGKARHVVHVLEQLLGG